MDVQRIAEEARTEPKEPRQVSRRRFLFGSGLAVGGAVAAGIAGPVMSPATLAEAGGGVVEAPREMTAGATAPASEKAIGHVSHNSAICTGCRSCEALCSLNHEGISNPTMARIQISTDYMGGWRNQAVVCKQCDYPECLYACPTGALHVDAATGARVIDAEKCIGCQSCAKACPQYPDSPILFNSETNKGSKCDLCGGNPLCVSYCPEGALSLVTGEA